MKNTYILDFKPDVDSVAKYQKDLKMVINVDRKPSGKNRSRLNILTTRQMTVNIFVQYFKKSDIVLHSRDNRLVRISNTYHAYEVP